MGTNCLGHHLFTALLHPILTRTAQTAPANSVRVVWVSSQAASLLSPKGGVDLGNMDYSMPDRGAWPKYGTSKAGNVFQGSEAGRRWGGEGIVSVVSQCQPWLFGPSLSSDRGKGRWRLG